MSEDRVFAKCAWRLIPFLVAVNLVNYLDRLNVGFAALTMNRDLGFSATEFGIGGGAFFVGYLLFQVPGNLILQRFGTRRWFFCIMAAWGLISSGCAFVQGPPSFYALRFLLGLAEAGFYPGVLFYLTLWFPKHFRMRSAAIFGAAIAVSGVAGGPLSSLILNRMEGQLGFHGWQWLFLLEGLPSVLLAFAALKVLPDEPREAAWLDDAEKSLIAARLRDENSGGEHQLSRALRDPRVIALALAGFAHGAALFGTTIWLPQFVQGMGYSTFATGFVVAIPYLVSAGAMIAWGRSSDARDERVWHLVLPWLLCAFGLVLAGFAGNAVMQIVGLTCAVVGILSAISPLLTMPASFLRGRAAAGAIGVVNTVVSVGAVVANPVIGMLKDATGGYAVAMALLAMGLVLSALLVLAIGRSLAPQPALNPQSSGSG